MGVFQNNLMGAAAAAASAGGAGFYTHQIANSCRFDSASSSYLYRSPGTASLNTKSTISCWLKRSNLANMGEASGSPQTIIGSATSEAWEFYDGAHDDKIKWSGGGGGDYITTGDVYRDTSAWYHMVFRYDSTQGAAADRVKIYKNGDLIAPSTYTESSYAASSEATAIGNGDPTRIGRDAASADNYFDGYMAEVIFTDGQSYAPTEFGETKNGVWIAKEPSVTFGDNGFHLKFQNSAALGDDSSGNNNDFTASGLGAHDQMLDTPTFSSTDGNGGNFCTLNPLTDAVNMTLSEGNLTWTTSTSNRSINCNFKLPAGTGQKWYWEHRMTSWAASESDDCYLGINIVQPDWDSGSTRGGGNTGNSYGAQGYKNVLGTDTSSYGAQIDTGDVWGVAVDLENNTIQFYKEGSAQGAAWSISGTTEWYPWIGSGGGSNSASGTFNFGQNGTFNGTETAGGNSDANGYGNFFSSVPSGFKALCSGNLPTADAVDPAQTDDDYPQKLFNTKLYTGTGSSNALTGVGFQPDWTWIKERGGANAHKLTDSTRGVTKCLEIDNTSAEATDSNGLTAFGSDGFTVGSDAIYNNSSDTYASWNWRLNGGTEVSNGTGGIASTVQVDPSGGFSLVKYSGTGSASTVGHGLSSAPTWIFAKNTTATAGWIIYTTFMTGSYYMSIDAGGMGADSSMWNNTNSTSSVFSVGTATNTNGGTMLAYCWANVEGYIKSGSYEGNGNVDGSFVYCGFRPAFIICKSIDSGTSWQLFDDKRVGYNVDNNRFLVDTNVAEATTDMIDILSNGFKMRIATDPNLAETYVYLAIASNPFQYATAR